MCIVANIPSKNDRFCRRTQNLIAKNIFYFEHFSVYVRALSQQDYVILSKTTHQLYMLSLHINIFLLYRVIFSEEYKILYEFKVSICLCRFCLLFSQAAATLTKYLAQCIEREYFSIFAQCKFSSNLLMITKNIVKIFEKP